jgi:hypothetical protein
MFPHRSGRDHEWKRASSPRRARLRSLYGCRRIDPFVFYKKLLGYFQYDRSDQFSLRCQPILVRFGFPGATGGKCFARKRSGNRRSLWVVQTRVRKIRAGLRVIAQFVYLARGDVVQLVRTLPWHPIQVISSSASVSYADSASVALSPSRSRKTALTSRPKQRRA